MRQRRRIFSIEQFGKPHRSFNHVTKLGIISRYACCAAGCFTEQHWVASQVAARLTEDLAASVTLYAVL